MVSKKFVTIGVNDGDLHECHEDERDNKEHHEERRNYSEEFLNSSSKERRRSRGNRRRRRHDAEKSYTSQVTGILLVLHAACPCLGFKNKVSRDLSRKEEER